VTDALKTLIDVAKGYKMEASEKEAQRRSFAYGNTHFENPLITRAMVDEQAEQLKKLAESKR
jgi:hypothetical protein